MILVGVFSFIDRGDVFRLTADQTKEERTHDTGTKKATHRSLIRSHVSNRQVKTYTPTPRPYERPRGEGGALLTAGRRQPQTHRMDAGNLPRFNQGTAFGG